MGKVTHNCQNLLQEKRTVGRGDAKLYFAQEHSKISPASIKPRFFSLKYAKISQLESKQRPVL